MSYSALEDSVKQSVNQVRLQEQDEEGLEKDFFGKKGDEFFFTAMDDAGNISIVDAEDNEVLGQEDVDIEIDSDTKEKDFLIAAAKNIDIDTISFPLVTKFDLLGIEPEEDEEESKEKDEEPEEEELKPEEPKDEEVVEPEEVPESKEESKVSGDKQTLDVDFSGLKKVIDNMVEQVKADEAKADGIQMFTVTDPVFKTEEEAKAFIKDSLEESVTSIIKVGDKFRVAVLQEGKPNFKLLKNKLREKIKGFVEEKNKGLTEQGGFIGDVSQDIITDLLFNEILDIALDKKEQFESVDNEEAFDIASDVAKTTVSDIISGLRSDVLDRLGEDITTEGKVPDDLKDELGAKIKKLMEDVKVFRLSDQSFVSREEAETFIKDSTKGGVLIQLPGDKGFRVGFKVLSDIPEPKGEVTPELDREERSSEDSNESIVKEDTESNIKKYRGEVQKAIKKVKDFEDKLKKEKEPKKNESIVKDKLKEDTASDLKKAQDDLDKYRGEVQKGLKKVKDFEDKLKKEKEPKKNESIVKESILEQDEYISIAKGLDTKEFAENVAKGRDKAKVIQDSDDPDKFAVVVMKEREDNVTVVARDLKTKEDANVIARSRPRTKVIRDTQDSTKYAVIQVREKIEVTKENIDRLLKKHDIK